MSEIFNCEEKEKSEEICVDQIQHCIFSKARVSHYYLSISSSDRQPKWIEKDENILIPVIEKDIRGKQFIFF